MACDVVEKKCNKIKEISDHKEGFSDMKGRGWV
jgi:hypothetical protein